MNRIRMTVLAGIVAVGGLGLLASSAHAQAPRPAAPVSTPRYFYGWGNNGWSYYYYPAAPSVPTYAGGYYSGMRSSARPSSTAPSAYRESATGKYVNLAKPWLRPLQ